MRFAFATLLSLALVSPAAAQKRLTPVEPPPPPLAAHEARLRLVLKEAYAADAVLRAVVKPAFQVEYAVGLRRGSADFEIFALRPSRQVWTYEAIEMMRDGRMGTMQIDGLLDDAPPTTAAEERPAAAEKAAARKRKADRRKRGRSGPSPADAHADVLEDLADSLQEQPDDPSVRDVTGEEIARMEEGLPENPADLPVARCAVAVDSALAAGLMRAWQRMLAEVGPDPWGQGLDGTSYNFAMAAGGRTVEGETWSPRPKTRPAKLAALAEAMRDHCEAPDPAKLARIETLARRLGGPGERRH
jgi:hypothetical protein